MILGEADLNRGHRAVPLTRHHLAEKIRVLIESQSFSVPGSADSMRQITLKMREMDACCDLSSST